jgi:hypothetical protein
MSSNGGRGPRRGRCCRGARSPNSGEGHRGWGDAVRAGVPWSTTAPSPLGAEDHQLDVLEVGAGRLPASRASRARNCGSAASCSGRGRSTSTPATARISSSRSARSGASSSRCCAPTPPGLPATAVSEWFIPPPSQPVKSDEDLRREREAKVGELGRRGLLRSERLGRAMLTVRREDFIPSCSSAIVGGGAAAQLRSTGGGDAQGSRDCWWRSA